MRILHTSDWHVGKLLRGRSRVDEHREVLGEIVTVADVEDVDLVLVVGDLFDTSAPTPEAEAVVYAALLDLADTGADVVVVAGNHDSASRLRAVAPVFSRAGRVHVRAGFERAESGGVVTVERPSGTAQVVLVPFLSQRHVVRAHQLMADDADAHAAAYADRMRQLVEHLCASFRPDTVRLVAAHCMCAGGVVGGGERSAHTIMDYWVHAAAFPPSCHYVALGHLHRTQEIPGACPIWYSGSPLQLDFGEGANQPAVLLVEAEPATPATVTPVPLAGGRRLRTVRGTIAQLARLADDVGDDHLRVVVAEPARVGVADEVRALFPHAVDVVVERDGGTSRPRPSRQGRSPHELFADYLAAVGEDDERLRALFAELYEERHEAG